MSLIKRGRTQRLLLFLHLLLMVACTSTETAVTTVSATRPLALTRVTATDTPLATIAATTTAAQPEPTVLPTITIQPLPTVTNTPVPTTTSVIPANIIYRVEDRIIQLKTDGTQIERFTLPYAPSPGELTLSPSGQYLLHNTGTTGDKKVYHLDTGETITLPQDGSTYIRRASWWSARPDLLLLETIAEDIYDDSRYTSSMFVLSDLDGSNWRPVHGRNIIHSIDLSPDGETVIFLRDEQPYLYHVDRGESPLDMSHYATTELDEVTIAQPRWSPDGGKVIWLMSGQKEGERVSGFAIFDLGQQSAHYLYPFANEGSEGWPMTPEWNAAGDRLAYVNLGSCVLTIFDLAGNTLFTDDDNDTCRITPDFWSPDGRWLAYFDTKSSMYMAASADGQTIRSLTPSSSVRPSHTWLPDGRLLIRPYQSTSQQRYWLYDRQTWTSNYFDLPNNAEYLGWLP